MATSRVERNATFTWGGYPVPWFVHVQAGVPDFRIVNTAKMMKADRHRLCMICGERLGVHLSFVIGPMCAVNRVSSEPPSHFECCEFAARNCPFLTDPDRPRRDGGFKEPKVSAAGLGIKRNPGVAAVWTTKKVERFQAYAGKAGYLWRLGEPTSVTWWCRGVPATRDEVMASINSGMPLLEELAVKEGKAACTALRGAYRTALGLIPLDAAGSQAA